MLAALAQYKMLEPLVAAKKARAIGVANMNASVLKYLLPRVSIPPAVNQAAHSIAGHYVTGTPLRHHVITSLHPLRHHGITSLPPIPLLAVTPQAEVEATAMTP